MQCPLVDAALSGPKFGSISRQSFEARVNAVPEAHRQHLLTMYANPVTRALALRGQNQDPPID